MASDTIFALLCGIVISMPAFTANYRYLPRVVVVVVMTIMTLEQATKG